METLKYGVRSIKRFIGKTAECTCGCRFVIEEEDLVKIKDFFSSSSPEMVSIFGYINCPDCRDIVKLKYIMEGSCPNF